MATATKKNSSKKSDPAPPIPAADSLARLKGVNLPGLQLTIADYIRHRDAGLTLSFDDWVTLTERLRANDRLGSPIKMLAGYSDSFRLTEQDQLEVLTAYIDNLTGHALVGEASIDSFGDFLATVFAEDPAAEAPAEEPVPAEGDKAPWDDAGASEAEVQEAESEPEPEPESEKPKKTPRIRPGAKKTEAGPQPADGWKGRRVVYQTKSKKVIYGVCTADHGGTIDLIDDNAEPFTNVGKGYAKFDDGPVVFAITKDQAAQVKKMTTPGRGLWPGKPEHEPLFELSRRVTANTLVVITVHNAKPEPFIDAFVYVEDVPEGENNTPYECEPRDEIAGEYKFEVEGLGTVPARVVVQ